MSDVRGLPPGQIEIQDFPRFGWGAFAFRFPTDPAHLEIAVEGDVGESLVVREELAALPRVDQVSDLHCVTTWTKRSIRWSGFRFTDFYEAIVEPRAKPHPDASLVVLRGQDGYAGRLPLGDLLARDVLLADLLDGRLGSCEGSTPRSFRRSGGSFGSRSSVTSVE